MILKNTIRVFSACNFKSWSRFVFSLLLWFLNFIYLKSNTPSSCWLERNIFICRFLLFVIRLITFGRLTLFSILNWISLEWRELLRILHHVNWHLLLVERVESWLMMWQILSHRELMRHIITLMWIHHGWIAKRHHWMPRILLLLHLFHVFFVYFHSFIALTPHKTNFVFSRVRSRIGWVRSTPVSAINLSFVIRNSFWH